MRFFLPGVLIVALLFEAYYIVVLRDQIRRNTEELRQISEQLQSLRQERDALADVLTSEKARTKEDSHGMAAEREP